MRNSGEANKTEEVNTSTKRKRRRIIWFSILGVVVIALAFVGIKIYRILYAPQDLFKFATINPSLLATKIASPTPESQATASPNNTESMTPAPTPSPTPDITQEKDIINILLVGVDRRSGVESDEKGTPKSEGTQPHADVQMIVAINFKEKKVDLISLPRDTLIHSPDLAPGVYKLNATFNVGGGFSNPSSGFEKVCQGAEYMLGGIPVDYYYAVDFDSVVKLVDTIGGVDFNVESASYSRKHKKGMQHMDGADVLFYLRTRKVGPEPGDLNRINRQKDMMVAIFKQLKEKGQLSMVPDLVNAANSGVYTNTNLEQTLALANFASTIDPATIGMHSMVGATADAIYWRWCFTDQKKRTALIKEVYGIDVPEQVRCSTDYTDWLRSYGFNAMVYMRTAKLLMDYADTRKADFTGDQQKAYDALSGFYADTKKAWELASSTMKSADTRTMINAENKMKGSATELAKLLGYKDKLKWTYDHHYWWLEPNINEIHVDFN